MDEAEESVTGDRPAVEEELSVQTDEAIDVGAGVE